MVLRIKQNGEGAVLLMACSPLGLVLLQGASNSRFILNDMGEISLPGGGILSPLPVWWGFYTGSGGTGMGGCGPPVWFTAQLLFRWVGHAAGGQNYI